MATEENKPAAGTTNDNEQPQQSAPTAPAPASDAHANAPTAAAPASAVEPNTTTDASQPAPTTDTSAQTATDA
ncbi:MAG TPA: hypothetical protein VE821_07050, partial [Pyrinomonadaceae bacterium]|nr:hypothetical protein [Pyrinomonadaceae bacterium]